MHVAMLRPQCTICRQNNSTADLTTRCVHPHCLHSAATAGHSIHFTGAKQSCSRGTIPPAASPPFQSCSQREAPTPAYSGPRVGPPIAWSPLKSVSTRGSHKTGEEASLCSSELVCRCLFADCPLTKDHFLTTKQHLHGRAPPL